MAFLKPEEVIDHVLIRIMMMVENIWDRLGATRRSSFRVLGLLGQTWHKYTAKELVWALQLALRSGITFDVKTNSLCQAFC